MDHEPTKDRSYWHLLTEAEAALTGGAFARAERRFLAAVDRREASPGRVFFTESITDGLQKLLRRRRPEGDDDHAGRWERRSGAFRAGFLAAGEVAVREGVRLAELRPEDDADANQPIIEAALFLVVRSRIFPEEPASAVPLLKGLFRTAARTGRLFDVGLVRHDAPLTEEDRLWLARRGGDLLEVFAEQGQLPRGSQPAREWAAAVLQLLHPRYFGTSSRMAEERAWLEAVSADRLLGDAAGSVTLYRAYLEASPEPGPRADEARVRTLELLANIDGGHFPVPRYDEALGALQSAGLAPGSELAGRYSTAVARIEHRRPDPDAGSRPAAWASAALGGDGTVLVVYWWGAEPRDLAAWKPGDDPEALDLFLEPCGGRVVLRDDATAAAVGEAWEQGANPWPVTRLVEALAEPDLPRSGLDETALRRLAAGESGPWRAGWRRELAHPDLRPIEDWSTDQRAAAAVGRALLAGLAVLALRDRIGGSEPALRAGLAELARRGDCAARGLYELLTAGDEAARAMDAGFAAWTVPLLWTRPDPFAASGRAAPDPQARPDLGRNDVAIVTTGDPASVLAAWGAGRSRWRVVLDRMDRLEDLAAAAAGVVGPLTVIPRDGLVHRLDAALDWLDDLVLPRFDPDDPQRGLLAVFHWVRIVSTHNGDLLDCLAVRPWASGAYPLYDIYAARVDELPRERPRAAAGAADDGWAAQFGQRARKAGFVAGRADLLPAEAGELDVLWGVFEGSDASWVFLDAAAVHARLRGDDRHLLLQSRGYRHLSVLTAAVWCRADLEDLLAERLAVYGPAWRLALTDTRPPPLLLAERGAAPGGERLGSESMAAALAHVVEHAAEGVSCAVAAPPDDRGAAFWRAAADGRFAVPNNGWSLVDPLAPCDAAERAPILVVPALRAFDLSAPAPAGDGPEAWRAADQARAAWAADVRRRCSLEIAALLAGGWAAVEILDGRWWRLLRDDDAAGGAGWNASRALEQAAPGAARAIDLPESAGDGRRRLPPALAAEVAAWDAARGQGASGTTAAAWPESGRRLEIGPPAPRRDALQAALAAAWERGRLDQWCLVVAERPWPGAARLVAASGAGGASVWPTGNRAPAPVLWLRPADLAAADLPEYVKRHRPAAIVVPDLEAWLPGAVRAAQDEAAALRAVLGLEAPVLLVQTDDLDPAWTRFLGETTGLVVGRTAGAPAEALTAAALPLGGQPAAGPPSALLVARMRRLLASLRPQVEQRTAAAGGVSPDLDGELVPAERLARLAGLDAAEVRDGVRVLRWAGRLAGDHLSAAESSGAGRGRPRTHAMLFSSRFAELEQQLDLLAEALGVLLPLWLGRLPAGGRTWIDLEQPPARMDAALLARVDTWLLGCGAPACGLAYTAPGGVLRSARRLVGLDRPLDATRDAVHASLDLFRRRISDVMASAVETGAGFLVDTGLETLRDEEHDFLALGAALGFWRWFGPPGPRALPLVDLLTLADSPTVLSRTAGWTLVGALFGVPDAPGADEAPSGAGRRALPLRSLFGGNEGHDDSSEAADRCADLAGCADEPRFLVLRGLAGTGRLETMIGALARARSLAADPGDATVYCPDVGVAAAAARLALRSGLPLDLRLPAAGDLPEAAERPAQGGAGADDVVLMPEIQRFAPETRYRIAQFGRRRRLLMSVDAAATAEAWENLFLTTPRTSDLRILGEQRLQARRLADQVRALVPGEIAERTRSLRRDRGSLAAEYAANLDQCVARIIQARAEDELPRHLRLSAPVAADLEFLAGALREQGWLAVDEAELDALALPGPCELLAAAADLLTAAGSLRAAPPAAIEVGDDAAGSDTDGAAADAPAPLLPALPRPAGAAAWPPDEDIDPLRHTLADTAAMLLAEPGLAWALAQPAARHRADELVERWGRRTLAEIADDALFQAWLTMLLEDLGRPDPASHRPLVRLAPVGAAPAVPVPGAVYLCLGGEEARQHYRVLSRVTDAALVLYQTRSPLVES
jgi:hypothetical protein